MLCMKLLKLYKDYIFDHTAPTYKLKHFFSAVSATAHIMKAHNMHIQNI